MPVMDGIEAHGKMCRINNQVPTIYLTAYTSYRDNFMTWAADAYIIKSADLTELKDKIKELLQPKPKKEPYYSLA
jgi:DNA-binding response OmpR family regulator